MAAWDRFLRDAELPPQAVRSVIEGSWSRCHSAGVDPARSRAQVPAPEDDLRRLQHRQSDLIDASVSIMEQARSVLAESGTMMILTDLTGVILETAGDPTTLEAAQDVRLVRGANWDELACGTNAIGTALSIGEPVQVHAAEHFCTGIKPWSCSATVVRDVGPLVVAHPNDPEFLEGGTVARLTNGLGDVVARYERHGVGARGDAG